MIINDRLKFAETLRKQKVILEGSTEYKDILDHTKTTTEELKQLAKKHNVSIEGEQNG